MHIIAIYSACKDTTKILNYQDFCQKYSFLLAKIEINRQKKEKSEPKLTFFNAYMLNVGMRK